MFLARNGYLRVSLGKCNQVVANLVLYNLHESLYLEWGTVEGSNRWYAFLTFLSSVVRWLVIRPPQSPIPTIYIGTVPIILTHRKLDSNLRRNIVEPDHEQTLTNSYGIECDMGSNTRIEFYRMNREYSRILIRFNNFITVRLHPAFDSCGMVSSSFYYSYRRSRVTPWPTDHLISKISC